MFSFIIILFLIALYALIYYKSVYVKVDTLDFAKCLSIRGILALMIILHHLSYRVNTPPQSIFVPLGAMVVGVFFLMSGYGLECSYRRKGDTYLDGFLRKRVLKLLLPYLMVIIAWNIEELYLYPNDNLVDAWGLVKQGNMNGILPYSWYVIVAMLLYVVWWLSHCWLKSEAKQFLAILVFWLAWCVAIYLLHWDLYWFFTSHMFLVGILYCKLESLIKRCNVYVYILMMLIVAALGTIEFYFFSAMLFNTAFSLLFVSGITLLNHRSKVLEFLGKFSYECYIIQALPLFALKDSGLPPSLIVVLCLCIDLVMAYVLHVSVSRLSKRIV